MKEVPDGIEIACENTFFRRVATEKLVRRKKPVLAVRERFANLDPERLRIIIHHVPSCHHS